MTLTSDGNIQLCYLPSNQTANLYIVDTSFLPSIAGVAAATPSPSAAKPAALPKEQRK